MSEIARAPEHRSAGTPEHRSAGGGGRRPSPGPKYNLVGFLLAPSFLLVFYTNSKILTGLSFLKQQKKRGGARRPPPAAQHGFALLCFASSIHTTIHFFFLKEEN
jgi:hypothetical protein